MKLLTSVEEPLSVSDNMLVFFAFEDKLKELPKAIQDVIALDGFKGEFGEVSFCTHPSGKTKKVFLVGVGKEGAVSIENLRRVSGIVEKFINKKKISSFSVVLPKTKFDASEVASALTEGFLLSNYRFDKYKSDVKEKSTRHEKITFVGDNSIATRKALDRALVVCGGVNFTRDLVNENCKDKTTLMFADIAKKVAKENSLKITILTEKDMQSLGMGLILAVNAGSVIPPRLVFLEYNGNKKSKDTYALVGKGVIFDSGGLNLKPQGYIENMRKDMAGAATVLSVIKTAAELKLQVNIVAAMPLVENLVSGSSYKPGETFKSYAGKTVEIGNTDAEGRLILADTLSYVIKTYDPKLTIDFATLTGAVKVALGERVAAVMGNNAEAITKLVAVGKKSGDFMHELPLFDEYVDFIKSPIADLSNSGAYKYGGAITAGLFLQEFVNKKPWVHLDIAGAAYLTSPNFYLNTLATGFGVRSSILFLEEN